MLGISFVQLLPQSVLVIHFEFFRAIPAFCATQSQRSKFACVLVGRDARIHRGFI